MERSVQPALVCRDPVPLEDFPLCILPLSRTQKLAVHLFWISGYKREPHLLSTPPCSVVPWRSPAMVFFLRLHGPKLAIPLVQNRGFLRLNPMAVSLPGLNSFLSAVSGHSHLAIHVITQGSNSHLTTKRSPPRSVRMQTFDSK